ncbi:hypothetical protein K1719_038433 [Acacia pycnantha]|nr:hypothetical protein K1719_038433 [Acacia pycnantha]
MNEKDSVSALVETEDDDNQKERRQEGRAAVLNFTAEEYAAWCLPWVNSLIIKVLGASFPTYIIRDRINRMWRPKDPLKLIPISNGYYIVSFSNKEDRDYAYQEGPWMIEDHYLIVQRWRPNVNPWKADIQCRITAWVRLPDVPFEFYNVESLRRIGNMIGKMIKIDRSTSIYDKDKCPTVQKEEEDQPAVAAVTKENGSDVPMKSGAGATVVTGSEIPGDSPFRKLQVLRRDMRGASFTAATQHGVNIASKKSVDKKESGDISVSHKPDMKQEMAQGKKAIKDELTKGKGPLKTEWVQVGAKRKNVNKGKIKGKTTKAHAREDFEHVKVGHEEHSMHGNSFNVLNSLDPNQCHVETLPHGISFNALKSLDPNKCHADSLPNATEIPQCSMTQDRHVEASHGTSLLVTSPSLAPSVNVVQVQDFTSTKQDNMDEQMTEQDKTEGEVATPQHSKFVSQ